MSVEDYGTFVSNSGGTYDHLPEQAFMSVGTIEECFLKKAGTLK